MSKKHIIAIAIAVAVVVAPAGGALGLSTDTETTSSSSISDVTDGLTITEPHNASRTYRLQVEGGSNTNKSSLANPSDALRINFTVNDNDSDQNGTVIHETDQNFSTIVNSGSPNDYYLNLSANTWGNDLQYGPDSNITVDVTVTFNATEPDASATTITTYVDPNGSDARIEFDDDERQTAPQHGPVGMALTTLGFKSNDSESYAADLTDETAVTENTSTVTLSMDNANATSAWSDVAEASDAGSLTTSGVVVTDVDGKTTLVPVFIESAEADWLVEDTTYATVSSDGKSVVVQNAGTLVDGTETVEFSGEGNEAVGFSRTIGMLRTAGAGPTIWGSAAARAANLDGNLLNGDT